ncbi:MBL fold metallo-hydrolase [Zavarzinia sp.]|uniref:MBL fold metallo-hydrolase n=1 Tax=Zavarzinia sp. TaxID=2027920 RepID=UPI0035663369
MAATYRRGLHELGDGLYAWLQPDGGWGWSNAGLIADGGEAVLVDTLFDQRLTAEMLAAMKDAVPGARIGTVVNTHANGDHCWGNALVEGAEIVASRSSAEEMAEVPPAMLASMMAAANELGPLGDYLKEIFGAFDFAGVVESPPTKTFCARCILAAGGRAIECVELGPAHTKGDTIVHVPHAKTVFTGDLLFSSGHPVMWAGPVGNWIDACDHILGLDVETVVPGHGPLATKAHVARLRDYLGHIRDEAKARFDAGLGAFEAARSIALDQWSDWGEAERIAVNVATLYREFSGDSNPPNVVELFSWMAQLHRDRRA